MTLKFLSGVCLAALAVSACEPAADTPPPPPPTEASGQALLDQQKETETPDALPAQENTENVVGERTATIDWAKAREDFNASSGNEEPMFDTAAAGDPPPVPILLPSGGPATVAGTGGPRFKQTADGYYAVYQYENYDVIVNGTNEVIGERAEGPRDETMKFTATAAGAQVSLSRYGADYLVEFECYEIDPATGTCLEEEEAMGVAESLVIRGTR